LAEVRSKQTDAVGDHSSSFAACEGRVDCGVCSVRQYGLWCVFCAPIWTVVCVLCVSVDCGVCSVRHFGLWYVFFAPYSARLDGRFVRQRSFLLACSSSEIAQWISFNSRFLGTHEINLIFGIHITGN
jgi:hypothetical protein